MRGLRALRWPRWWLATWIVLMLLTVVVSLLPMPRVPVPIDHFDKIEHCIGYLLLAAYAAMLFEAARARRLAYFAVFALGVLIEGLQTLVPWRSGGDVADMAANAAGVLLGSLVATTPLRQALQWFERAVGGRTVAR